MKKKRLRSHINEHPFVGKKRFELYKKAIEQFNQAMDSGFYLEAITICESLITDRLESRCGELGKPLAFQTLGALIKQLKKVESDTEMLDLITNDLDDWRQNRNTALHEIVKFEKGVFPNWENRIEASKVYAESGMKIFRKIDTRIRKLRQ